MNKEFLKMQKIAGLITENQFNQLNEDSKLEQDIKKWWDMLQNDASERFDGHEAEWKTWLFIDEYPEYEGKENEIDQIVKNLNYDIAFDSDGDDNSAWI